MPEDLWVMPRMRVLAAVEPIDMRKETDGLAAVCEERLQAVKRFASSLEKDAARRKFVLELQQQLSII